jgi:ABC-type multidrug transport system fused ATPase/permease subunit
MTRRGGPPASVPSALRGVVAEAVEVFRGERRLLLAVSVLVLLNRGAALAPAAASKIVIDEVIGGHRPGLLASVALVLLAAVLVEAASGFALYGATGIMAQRAVTRLRRRLHAHVLGMPTGFFDGTLSGGLISRLMADPDAVRDVFGPGLVQLASGVLTAILAVALLLALDWSLTAAVLGILAASLLGLLLALSRLYRAFRAAGQITSELTGRLAEVLGGIEVVKTYRTERREAYAFTRESHRLLRAVVRAFGQVGRVIGVTALATGLVTAVTLVVAGRAVLVGRLTVGDLVLYLFLAGLLAAPLLQIAAHVSELGRAGAALGRIARLREVPTEDDHDRELGAIAGVTGAIAFDRVSYAYGPGHRALHEVSFEALPETTVAIVGPNGSGKTTAMRLLAGLVRPTGGRILADGRDLAGVRLRAWRAHVAAVWQESFLFDGTVADNITYGRPEASPSEIRRAASLAHCEELLHLIDENGTRVGERGVQLSGGQRQRVAIARAILADPRILLLDEATAHLDPESEALIRDALERLRAGRTTFVIAHRLATVRHADQILVLKEGELVERGTHEELMERRGAYWRLASRFGLPELRQMEGVA